VPAEAKFDFVMMGTGSPAVVQLAPEPTESAKPPPDAEDPTKPAPPP
jgi:hypothetical protein